jgi:hypothetical protein
MLLQMEKREVGELCQKDVGKKKKVISNIDMTLR